MTEHKGTSFVHSCVKVPVDPYSRQPTPLYERPRSRPKMNKTATTTSPARRQVERASSKASTRIIDNRSSTESESAHEDYNSFLEFIESIPYYDDVHHLSNEQFKQKLDYLKRKQRMILKNLRNCLEQDENIELTTTKPRSSSKSPSSAPEPSTGKSFEPGELQLKGKRCNFEESRTYSPLLYPSGSFSCLAEDQDLLTYRCKDREKDAKTRHNEEILKQDWRSGSESKSDSLDSDDPEIGVETKSLPPRSPKRWHPTLPKPFSSTLREDVEKYMSMVEQQAAEEYEKCRPSKKNPAKKRRIRPVPLTSKIPLYDKLIAAKEERSRLVREESALSLMSQVRPFKLECDRRALRALTRSSPELSYCKRIRNGNAVTGTGFKAKPVPRNLFSTDVYDRMLEDEYFRNLEKRIRAAELLRTSSLPPSMARRERCKSASLRSLNTTKSLPEDRARSSLADGRDSVALSRGTPIASSSDRSRSSVLATTLPPHGINLAAILRAQAAREKLEREFQEKLEEKRREQMIRLRKALISRKPAWRALRSAARHEHERDLDFRVSLRRDEAREQAERHRLHMEMMLDRVTQIPTLFERYSQSFQSTLRLRQKLLDPKSTKKKKSKRQSPSSVESYVSLASSCSRPTSSSLTSSSGCTLATLSRSSGSGKSVHRCSPKFAPLEKRKSDRGPLKVSINEKAELIEDNTHVQEEEEEVGEEAFSIDSATSQMREEREKRALNDENENNEKE